MKPSRGVEAPSYGLFTPGATPSHLERSGGHLVLDRAKGLEVWDKKGRRHLDAISGYGAVSIGYGRASVARAVAEQLERLSYAPLDWRAHEPALRLAERLLKLAPEMSRVFFCSGGSEAVDIALKMARLAAARVNKDRQIVLYRRGSYHGATFGASSVTGIPELRRPFEPLLPWTREVCQPGCGLDCISELEKAILREGPARVAAFIAEPITAVSRMILPPPDYWPKVRALCDRYGVLLIADEVLTGIGRTGRWLGMSHWGVAPDLTLLAKGLSGGYAPLGAVIISKKVARAFEDEPFEHGYTFGGHPGSCAAALEVLKIIEEEGLVENAAKMGRLLKTELERVVRKFPSLGPVTGLGLLCSIGFPPGQGLRETLHWFFSKKGLICHLTEQDSLGLAPSLCVRPEQISEIAGMLEEAFTALLPR